MTTSFRESINFLSEFDPPRTTANSRPALVGMYEERKIPTTVWLTGALQLWKQGYKGAGVTIGVIDSGIAPHPDLVGTVIAHYDYVDTSSSRTALDPHGTHVAGTIAANGKAGGIYGVAPEAKIIDYRVLGTDGSGSYQSISQAVRDAAERCQIINMSLGGPFESPELHEAIKYAVNKKNVLVVVASGNFSGNAVVKPTKKKSLISYPAGFPEVVGVGAVDLTASGKVQRAYFSYFNGELDLCADGVDVYSCGIEGGDYVTMSGTSMASPAVSGLAALLLCKAKLATTVTISEATLYAMLKSASIPLTLEQRALHTMAPDDWLYGRGLASVFTMVPSVADADWIFPHLGDGAPDVGHNHEPEDGAN